MTIFNIELFGSDADWFCNLTVSEQVTWIKSNTNQVNDDLISEFLKTPLNSKKEYCIPCRDKKQKLSIAKIVEDGNISKGNEQEVAEVNRAEVNEYRGKRNKKK